jgi:F0F1-type ATP synthase membrane subunit b/b'
MSNTERKKEIDDCVDLMERAKAMLEEMKTSDESDLEAMREEATEENEDAADTEEMELLTSIIDNIDCAIDELEGAIDYTLKAV